MSESFLTDLRVLIDVDSSTGTRARYSSDAGLTRIPPLAVAFPRTPEQAITAFDLARAHGDAHVADDERRGPLAPGKGQTLRGEGDVPPAAKASPDRLRHRHPATPRDSPWSNPH